MTTISMRVASLSRPASSVKSKKKVVRTITRADAVSVNRSIEPKIRQNERERTASMSAAAKCIVGGKA